MDNFRQCIPIMIKIGEPILSYGLKEIINSIKIRKTRIVMLELLLSLGLCLIMIIRK